MPVKPLSPSEVAKAKIDAIPDGVIEAFNELIAKGFDGKTATVRQDAAVKLICKKMKVRSDKVFENDWLDVEPYFRRVGWTVNYDKPGYNENYEATYEFIAGKTMR